jgi:hypothetical protein
VLGAAQNNGLGGAGVAPNARLIALRSCYEEPDECYGYIQTAAMNWAADRGARVIVFHYLFGSTLEPDFQAAIVNHPNVLFVAIPSGNGGPYDADPTNPQPCVLPVGNVLCVSSSSPTDGLDCGAFGPNSVDLAVPTRGNVTTANGGGFVNTGGCFVSYAAPIAGGVATMLFGLEPRATAFEVRSAMMDSARRVPAWSGKSVTGGILDAEAAVKLFQTRRHIVHVPPPPVLGKQFNVEPAAGTITVSLPRGAKLAAHSAATVPSPIKGRVFIPLKDARQIPIGSFVNARSGHVRLTSARDTKGHTIVGNFDGGVFQVLQSRKTSQKGLTELRLKGSSFSACTKGKARKSALANAARKRSKRKIRKLRGNAKGRFRTRGRYSSATVRGTKWTVTDRCDGTLTSVQRGRVAVTDFHRHKNISVKAGKHYLAKAP